MDDLKKLLENAGVVEAGGYTPGNIDADYQENWSEMLNDFSSNFEFQVQEDESIEVYSIAGTLIGSFESFDEMITTGLGN